MLWKSHQEISFSTLVFSWYPQSLSQVKLNPHVLDIKKNKMELWVIRKLYINIINYVLEVYNVTSSVYD